MIPALLLVLACRGQATVQEPCVDDPTRCPACDVDAECVFQGNSCYDTVDCAHVGAGLAYAQLGCSEALEYRWPDDADCACIESVCQYDP